MNGIAEMVAARRGPAIRVKKAGRNISMKEAHEQSNRGFESGYRLPWVEKVGSSEAYRKGYEQIDWSKKE